MTNSHNLFITYTLNYLTGKQRAPFSCIYARTRSLSPSGSLALSSLLSVLSLPTMDHDHILLPLLLLLCIHAEMDLKNAPLHYTKRGQRRLHQRHIPDFTPTLLSAYLCHADVTIPSYSIIHIVSPNKLYLHDKSLPRAPHTPPHTTSNHTWNTATLLFISICDNYISKQ